MDPAPPPDAPAPPPDAAPAAEPEAAREATVARKRVELSKELQRARGWILGIGIALYAFRMVEVWELNAELPAWLHYQFSLIWGVVLLAFVALWWFARRRPRLCCVLALCLFWALEIWRAWLAHDSSLLFKGLPFKAIATLGLIQGIRNANTAEKIRADLARVFA